MLGDERLEALFGENHFSRAGDEPRRLAARGAQSAGRAFGRHRVEPRLGMKLPRQHLHRPDSRAHEEEQHRHDQLAPPPHRVQREAEVVAQLAGLEERRVQRRSRRG